MTYLLELEDAYNRDKHTTIEADSESMLEELSARIKVAFDYPYDDLENHSFNFNGHVYVPSDSVGAVCEMMFETWDPDPELNIEEPDWYEMYQSSDIPLSEVFTVIGSAIVYKQDGWKARVTLVGREETPSQNDKFEKYDYLQDEI
ncbi:MAG: hypothetical protein IJS05_03710 [Paludibacteraceae bacterium]|nr:hypothetical protein [Paludibacteraceae bacterium]